MTDSKIFHVIEGTNGKFEIKYTPFGKKDDTIWQKHNREIVGTLSGQLNEPKRMEAFKLKSKQDRQIQVQDKIINNLIQIRTDVNIEITKINETQKRLDVVSVNHNATLTKLSSPPNWLKNHSKLDPLKDIILQEINHCNETKSELNKSRKILLELIQDIDISIQRLKDDVISNSTNQEKFKSKPNEYTALLKNQIDNNNNVMKKIRTAPEIASIILEFLHTLKKESTQSSLERRRVIIEKPISLKPLASNAVESKAVESKAVESKAVVTKMNNVPELTLEKVESSPIIRSVSIKNPISLKPLISEGTAVVKSVNNNGLKLETQKVNLNSSLEKQ